MVISFFYTHIHKIFLPVKACQASSKDLLKIVTFNIPGAVVLVVADI